MATGPITGAVGKKCGVIRESRRSRGQGERLRHLCPLFSTSVIRSLNPGVQELCTAGSPLVHPVSYGSVFLFCLITLVALVGVPLFAYFHDYSWVDWVLLSDYQAMENIRGSLIQEHLKP